MPKELTRSESDLLVFISSRMNDEMEYPREIAVAAVNGVDVGRPWAFEFSPASSESADESYLRKVREADFVVWLVGRETTQPVIREVNEAITYGLRLLVFKLPADERDSDTMDLLEQVRTYARWRDVPSLDDLSGHIQASMSDEIIRGLRNPAPPTRDSRLRQAFRLSISRCKDAWLSLGVEENIALEMAEDCELGDVLEIPSAGVHAVVDSQGSGKTLVVERLLQRAINNALADSSQPFPLFISARDLNESVQAYIEGSLQGNADPFDPRVLLIIDGIDELGANRGTDLYRQVRVYVDANARATVILTARPLPGLEVVEEEIRLERLDDKQSLSLISKVAGYPLEPNRMYSWPESIRDVAQLPLFAVMIGSLLRKSPGLSLAAPGQIIENLADRALQQTQGDSVELDQLLQELAVKAIDSGTRVRLSVMTSVQTRQRLLTNSRLIEQSADTVDFALPIFREWYAARALIEGYIGVDHLQQNSDRWLPSLSVVLNSEHNELRESLLGHIMSTDPGLASLLLKEHYPEFTVDDNSTLSLGTEEAVGARIRVAMAHWKAGLGDLFTEIGSVDHNGEVASLGVRLSDDYLTTAWYAGESDLPPVVNLAEFEPPLSASRDWPRISSISLSQENHDPFLWSYIKTHAELSESLSDSLQCPGLAMCSRDTLLEFTWVFFNDQLGRNRPRTTEFGLDRCLETIASCRELVRVHGPDTTFMSLGGRLYGVRDVEMIGELLLDLVDQGVEEIREPWPSADLPLSSSYVWSSYSDQRLLERAIAIYSGALRIYTATVDRWFSCFSARLPLYRILPVRLEGWLTTRRQRSPQRDRPTLNWYGRILPQGQANEVAFEMAPSEGIPFDSEELFQQERHAFAIYRRSLPGEFSLSWTTASLRNVFETYPATELALDWLRQDLQALEWDLRP